MLLEHETDEDPHLINMDKVQMIFDKVTACTSSPERRERHVSGYDRGRKETFYGSSVSQYLPQIPADHYNLKREQQGEGH